MSTPAACAGCHNQHFTVDEWAQSGVKETCSDCHMDSENFQLTPAAAQARFAQMSATGVDDPLFRAIDANDFRINGATAHDYTNLTENGLIRVTLPLPANVKLLDCGIRGVIPTSARLSVAVEAIRMVQAGGTYIPASCVMNARRPALAAEARRLGVSLLTPRQSVVVEALRRGKANKAIAYERRMRESTVKVHVRNVMKKLGAKNRTEVAYIANNLFNASRGSASRMFAAEAVCNPHSRLARVRAPGANLAVQLCERQSSLVDD